MGDQSAAASPPAWLDELQTGGGPPWHAMGTRALVEAEWLVADEHLEARVGKKKRLLEVAHATVAARPSPGEGEAAAEEAAALVAQETGRSLDPARPPLEAAALLVQEDLCVLVRRDDGWRLDAGVVCFPSMWRIGEKVGLPLTAVHGPVPAYADELAERVDRFLDRLRPERPVWRRNWLVHESPELHRPDPPPHGTEAPEVPEGLWLRSERQTLRRLPRSGGIVFTICTQSVPMRALSARPDIAAGLAVAVRSWSDGLVAYRRAGGWREPLVEWLDATARRSPRPA